MALNDYEKWEKNIRETNQGLPTFPVDTTRIKNSGFVTETPIRNFIDTESIKNPEIPTKNPEIPTTQTDGCVGNYTTFCEGGSPGNGWVCRPKLRSGQVIRMSPFDYDCRIQGEWNFEGDIPIPPVEPPIELPVGKVYTQIEDVLHSTEVLTYGIWSDGVGNLTSFHTCSRAATSQSYHRVVYDRVCTDCEAEPQFDLAYGHDAGSGSLDLGGYDWLTPTNATYGQYRLLCLNPDESKFKIGSKELDQVYILNVRRRRMQDRVDEGNVELNLAHLSGSQFIAGGGLQNAHTGSNVTLAGNGQTLRLIDDSRLNFDLLSDDAKSGSYRDHVIHSKRALYNSEGDPNDEIGATHRVGHGGQVYYMVSGSIEKGIHNTSNPHVYGLMYPHLGIMVLDGDRLDASASFGSVTGSEVRGDNAAKMFTAMSGAAQYTDPSGDVMGFQARRKVTEFSEYYFIRVKNADYNFTNNPTWQTGSYGAIIDTMVEDPKVYFTTVGLYNARKECIAVGKVSRAIQKTCVSEALFKLRIKY
tara:strand:- start:934 stop:2517 length:1584 start_codon:yes stop_codon:yes gene_type:complete